METYYSLQDFLNIAKDSGNNNPGIFIQSDTKEKSQYEESFCPTNIYIDSIGDIIIQVDKKLLD